MKHLGDITKISGWDIEPVDCITGGSPCQDLSVAGKRAGLAGERSGLFMEQMRIVKEMRAADVQRGRTGIHCRPRFMVWENVPGAFSSGNPKGADFAAVLEEIVKVCEEEAPSVSVPEKGWPPAGCLYDEMGGWSIAWRVHDAQFWGVPQRRKRIALVADFGGKSAPEILFERKGLCRDSDEGCTQGQRIASVAQESVGGAISFQERAGKPGGGKGILIQQERTGALSTLNNQSVLDIRGCTFAPVASILRSGAGAPKHEADILGRLVCTNFGGICLDDQGGQQINVRTDNISPTLRAEQHGYQPCVVGFDVYNMSTTGEVAKTINAAASDADHIPVVYDARGNGDGKTVSTITGDHKRRVTDYSSVVCEPCYCADQGGGKSSASFYNELSPTLSCTHGGEPVVYRQGSFGDYIEGEAGPLRAAGGDLGGGSECLCVGNGQVNQSVGDVVGALNTMHDQQAVYSHNIVRRLTPIECERLQGFPDGWTDIGEWVDSKGKKRQSTDGARYKALGNSIALPFWKWLCKRISAQYERDATLGSLFDGIGGFPYCWERVNGKGSARWASEIDEFPMAVTKVRFGEE